MEAVAFRDALAQFESAGAVILGISPDTVEAEKKFADKFNLPFRLLADTDHRVAEAYGVWGEKSLYGRKYMGVDRTTFLIGPDGRIRSIFRKVKVDGHADEVLTAMSEAETAQ